MPTKVHKNTFSKGMNKDISNLYMPKEAYRDAKNFRISTDEDSTIGILENVKGNSEIYNKSNYPYEPGGGVDLNQVIMGGTSLDNDLIFFTYNSDTNVTRIFRATIDGESVTDMSLLWSDLGKATEDKMNLSTDYPLKVVSRKENENVEKIYWVDYTNYLRYANIGEYLTSDKQPKSASNIYVSVKYFDTVSNFHFVDPTLTKIGGGGLKVGMVQYSYQLYNKSGSETSFAPATGLFHITKSSESGANSENYRGSEPGEYSGKSLSFSINLGDQEYDSIRIVSLHYENYKDLPAINIISESRIGDSGIVNFTDDGSGYIGSYTIEQFTALSGLYKAKDITSSKNFLFLANVKENHFDIGDYDARAYRFNKGGSLGVVSRLVESNGDVYFVYTDGSWEKVESDGTPITSGSDWAIPENADLKNLYNVTEYDGSRESATDADTRNDYLGNFKYDASGDLGGTGKNISFSFGTKNFVLDNSENYRVGSSYEAESPESTGPIGFSGYYSPYNTANHRSYQRSEIYRFGIVFFDKFGRESTVKWIADIRMPNIKDNTNYYYIANIDEEVSDHIDSKILYPTFTIKNYPEGAVSYKIVRVERSNSDRTVVFSGLARPTGLKDSVPGTSTGTALQSYHCYSDGGGSHYPEMKGNLIEFISPEISFYKDFSPVNNDYLELHDINGQVCMNVNSGVITQYYGQEVNIKYRRVIDMSSNSFTQLPILGGKLITPMSEGESVLINDKSFYPYYGDAGETADTNPCLILDSSLDFVNYMPDVHSYTDHAVKYVLYRRHIFDSQYGGPTYLDRTSNEYISAGGIKTIPTDRSTTTYNAEYGDTFINMYDHSALTYNRDGYCVFVNFIFPVESSINLALRHDDSFSKVFSKGNANTYKNIRYDGNEDVDYSPLYLYNTVYSQENTSKKYFPRPADEEFQELETFSTRILVSERKFNGESSDSWLKFLPNNFIDVDATYGEITNIKDFNNNLLFWQPNAVGLTDVDPRSLITDNNPGALVLGTGAVLTRFDYLSTNIGNSDTFNIVNAPKGIYWYDSILNTIARYNGEYIERLSKLKGVQSYLNSNDFDKAIIEYDPKYDEILISLSEGNVTGTTLVYNELVDAFTGFYTYLPSRYFRVRDKIISSENDDHLYMHGTSNSNYGTFYNTDNDSTLLTLINSDIDHMKVFDAINYPSYSYNNLGILDFTNTFESYKAYNSYQNTNEIPLIFGNNISRKKGMWSFHIARNDVTEDPETNPDILDSSNLGNNSLFKSRMRDHFLVLDLTYNNNSNNRFIVPYINTKYRISYR